MELWVSSLVSGIFSIAVVAIGAWLVNNLEKRRRDIEVLRLDKANQHEAVVRFLQADRKLSAQLLRDVIDITFQRDPEKISPAEFLAITRLRMLYFNDCLQELLILNAAIYDPKVGQAYDLLFEAYLKQFDEHRDLLSDHATPGKSELEESIPRSVGDHVSRKLCREALQNFVTVSRRQYRVFPA